MPNILPGYKTYIVAVLMMITGVVNIMSGDMTGWQAIAHNGNLLLEGAGFMALRIGVGRQ